MRTRAWGRGAAAVAVVVALQACGSDQGAEPSDVEPGSRATAQALVDQATAGARADGVGDFVVSVRIADVSTPLLRTAFDLSSDSSVTEVLGQAYGESGPMVTMRSFGDIVYTNAQAFGRCWGSARARPPRPGVSPATPPAVSALLDAEVDGLRQDSTTSVVARVRSMDLLRTVAPKVANEVSAADATRTRVHLEVVGGAYHRIVLDVPQVFEDLEKSGVTFDGIGGLEEVRDRFSSAHVDLGWESRVPIERPEEELTFDLQDVASMPDLCGGVDG